MAESEWQAASQEAARTGRKAEEKGDQRARDRAVRMQRKAQQAAHRLAALRLVVEGPLPITVGVLFLVAQGVEVLWRRGRRHGGEGGECFQAHEAVSSGS